MRKAHEGYTPSIPQASRIVTAMPASFGTLDLVLRLLRVEADDERARVKSLNDRFIILVADEPRIILCTHPRRQFQSRKFKV